MKQFRASCALSLAARAACGKPPRGKKRPRRRAAPQPVDYFHVDPATAGTLTGSVTFPRRQAQTRGHLHGSRRRLPAGQRRKDRLRDAVLTGKNGGLANAFVYIQAGLEGKKFEPNTQPVVLDQHGCMFLPRVIGIRAGQTLDLKNGDSVSHNVHPHAGQ